MLFEHRYDNDVIKKLNREKKKLQVAQLEHQIENLTAENLQLKSKNSSLEKGYGELITEVQYLKNIIANQSSLSKLLQNIPSVKGFSLRTSFSTNVKDDVRPQGNGVCLHVAGDNDVSLEF